MMNVEPIPEYRDWVRTFGCITPRRECSGPIDLHHVKSRGAGGKDQANLVPLCHYHHMNGHSRGWQTFQKQYDVDLRHIATRLWETWVARLPYVEQQRWLSTRS